MDKTKRKRYTDSRSSKPDEIEGHFSLRGSPSTVTEVLGKNTVLKLIVVRRFRSLNLQIGKVWFGSVHQ